MDVEGCYNSEGSVYEHPVTRPEGWGAVAGCVPRKKLALGLTLMLGNTNYGRGLGKVFGGGS